MDNQDILKFPVLVINEVIPVVRKNDKVFAYQMKVTTELGNSFIMYETKGLDLTRYIGLKMECMVEITRATLIYDVKKDPEDIGTPFHYRWLKRPYEVFPELVEIKSDMRGAPTDAMQKEAGNKFDKSALNLFNSWGLNGLNIGIYQAKPFFSSAHGFYFMNEYEFESDIEFLQLDQEVNIRIDEVYLRGIRPIDSLENQKPKQLLPQPKPSPNPPKQEPQQPKPNKFGFSID